MESNCLQIGRGDAAVMLNQSKREDADYRSLNFFEVIGVFCLRKCDLAGVLCCITSFVTIIYRAYKRHWFVTIIPFQSLKHLPLDLVAFCIVQYSSG